MSFSESFCLVTSKLCGTNDSPDSTLRKKNYEISYVKTCASESQWK